MYMVGAYIVSTLTGMRYPDFVDSRIFKPLGMTSSTYSIDEALQTGRFTNTWTSFGRLIPPWIEEEYVDLTAGPGGVISSVEDLARHAIRSAWNVSTDDLLQVPWVKTILNGGIDPDTNVTIIPSAQFDVITSAHSIVSPNVSAETSTLVYGLGWFRTTLIGHDVSESWFF
jgi:CubicO group peptidase (beta-lactamase class C family)